MTRREALEILGLGGDASLDEARMAYRMLAKTYHPDKNPALNAGVMFRIISDAWEFVQKNTVQEHTETETTQKRAEEETARERDEYEAQRKRAAEKAKREGAEHEAQRKRAEEARRQAETARADELNRRKEKEIEDKIWLRSYAVWFVICFIYFCIGIIGSWLGIDGFVGSEPLNIGNLFYLLLGVFVMASILGSITGGVIVKIRKWLK